MIVRRRNPLSILGLVASDASDYEEGAHRIDDLLALLPDSDPGEDDDLAQPLSDCQATA